MLVLAHEVSGQRIKDDMYTQVTGAHCFRRLNGTHVTGCSSKNGGSVGVLHLIEGPEDIDFLVNSHPSPPYAAIISPALYTRENILRLRDQAGQYISVLVLINNVTGMDHFSQESPCPNEFSSLLVGQPGENDERCSAARPEQSWNPWGSGLLQEDFPFPVYYVYEAEEIDKLRDCYFKFNAHDLERQRERSLCSIEVKSFMSAAVSSANCIRRSNFYNSFIPATKYCDPLQGKNVYATLFPRPTQSTTEEGWRERDANERIVLVSTRTDTTTMFDGRGQGAMDSVLPFTVLISVAHFLAKVLPSSARNVLFVFFNGESYDYIGSQRFVYDLQTGAFPTRLTQTKSISMDNIELMIDIGTLDDLTNLEIYQATPQPMGLKMSALFDKINQNCSFGIKTGHPLQTTNLPPVSAQSFLRENASFPAIIITSPPGNRYYHSVYDGAHNLRYRYGNHSKRVDFTQLEDLGSNLFGPNSLQMEIRNVSSLIAMSIYELLEAHKYEPRYGTNSVLIDEFLHCFLETSDCPLFRATLRPETSIARLTAPPSRYISVHNSITADMTIWTYQVLGLLVGQRLENVTKDECLDRHLPYQWMAGYSGTGECHYSTQNTSLALSPAFLNETYDWTSYRYSTWTESTWSEMSARIFLRPSPAHETLTLSIGFVVMVISFVLVFLINSRSDVLFNQGSTSTIPIAAQPTQC
ncbi:nicastrin [Anopheles cruzii]|uniref:nicastrin n=1 Tax=Anopheles cruzii TaxID=68878 RepID=UPI0022EC52E5|nr:nicastrin [Anopheles cruzii]